MKLLLLMALLPLCLFVNPNAYAQEIDPQEEAEYLQRLYQQYPGISREEVQQKAKDFRLQKISVYWQQAIKEANQAPVKSQREPRRSAASPSARTSNVLAARSSNAASAAGLVPDSVEYAALEALHNSLNGSGWTDRTNWLQGSTSSDFDNWSGITVENGDVTEIFLVNNNLQGTLSSMLGDLTALKKIVIYEGASGYLLGSIPSEIGQLVNLEELSLGGSYRQEGDQGLSGSLPASLGQLTSLRKLWIGYTAISGSIPEALGQLKQLRTFRIFSSELSGAIPGALGELTNLEEITLSENRLTGSIPASLAALSQLRTLNVSYNQMSGALPAALSNLTSLTDLVLHDNQFTGRIPDAWGNFNSLRFLNISMNDVQGDFPSGFANLPSLSGCYLFDNRFTFQTIEPFFTGVNASRVANFQYAPQDTVRLASADSLAEGETLTLSFPTTAQQNQYTWQKQISGEWQPMEGATQKEYTISSMTLADSGKYRCVVINRWATELTLYTHPVTVTVTPKAMDPETEALHDFLGATADLEQWPDSWKTSAPIATWEGVSTENARVTAIKLTDKNIDSEIPESFSNLTELRKLELAGNRLRGSIPKSLGRLQKLEVLDLQRNRLTGPIPPEIGQMRNLRELNLQKNQLTGSIPASVGQLKNVYNLRLNSNQLSGSLPAEVGDMTNLRQLFVNKNKLTGPIPPSLGRLSNLKGLHLEDNQLSGPIPAALGNPPRLEQLYLHKNRLSGPVPASFGKLSRLKTLSLHQNRLEGRIPNTWVNMRNLEELNISNNNFTYLPDFSRHPRIFRRFDVRRNRLTFESLIPHHHFAPFRYDPQKPVGIPRIIDINDCNPLSLDYNVDLNIRNNRYDWYLRNELWINTNYPSIRLNIPTRHYSGSDRLLEYYARVSNPAFPNFYLRTQPITLRNNLTQTCNTATASSEPYNYVKTETVLRRGKKTAVSLEYLSKSAKETHYDYIDGLGRVMQQVDVHGSPSGKSIVQPIEYDPLGRVAKSYLPYAANNASSSYRTDAIAQVASFYQADDDKIANTDHPYAETIYEASPLGRVLEQGAVGEVWQPTTPGDDDNKTMKYGYRMNQVNEVRQWKSDKTSISRGEYYEKGSLFVSETRDEHNRKVTTYQDKRERTLLKQVAGDAETLETHYIYDDFNNLRVVIPPKAAAQLTQATYSLTDALLRKGCYVYEYDERQRMVSQQVPGADPVHMVYDAGDRLVFTQDGNQRKKNQWTFTKYDQLNRPIITGLLNNTALLSREQMQRIYGVRHMTERYSSLSYATHPGQFGYSDDAYPNLTNKNVEVLTVTFYDDYRFITDLGLVSYTFRDMADYGDYPGNYFRRVQGQVTGQFIRFKAPDSYSKARMIHEVYYYDDEYRLIQSVEEVPFSGVNIYTTQYDFAGRMTNTIQWHCGFDKYLGFWVKNRYMYDHAGRVKNVYHQIQDEAEVLLTSNEYNEIGELVEENLHQSADGNDYLQSRDYRYNERGWLQRINKLDLGRDNRFNDDDTDLFGMTLQYYKASQEPQYNGNINEIKWTNQTQNTRPQEYLYSYDKLDRLKKATHIQYGETYRDPLVYDNYSVTGPDDSDIPYDVNGNIQALVRNQDGKPIDHLSYEYGKGNQLQKVRDATNEAGGFAPGEGGLDADYYYDNNGNLTDDYHKGIVVTYNHLNLPEIINFADGSQIKYVYDALGRKWVKTVTQGEEVLSTYYHGGFQYEQNFDSYPKEFDPEAHQHIEIRRALAFIQTGKGRAYPYQPLQTDACATTQSTSTNEGRRWVYHYDLTDHVGNVRVTAASERVTDTYLATMEPERAETEEVLFGHVSDTREKDEVYNTTPACETLENPDRMSHLNAVDGKVTGLTRSLAVQPGDVVRLSVQARYQDNEDADPIMMGSLLPTLLSASGIAGGEGGIRTAHQAFNALFGASTLMAKDNNDPGPYAFLNYLLFDRESRPVNTVAGMLRVSKTATTAAELIATDAINIPQAGYLYTWLSNDSEWDVDVFFDDFRVEHEHGVVVQAQDYYPFGLVHQPEPVNLPTTETTQHDERVYANNFSGGSGEFDVSGNAFYFDEYGEPDPLYGVLLLDMNYTTYEYAQASITLSLEQDETHIVRVTTTSHSEEDFAFTIAGGTAPANLRVLSAERSGLYIWEFTTVPTAANTRITISPTRPEFVLDAFEVLRREIITKTDALTSPYGKYLFQSAELTPDLGLNWYDFGLRGNYLPDLGRWGSSDPAAATYESYSNYHFGGNNPLRNFEVDGARFYSTHTDWSGNVVAVYDDGDLGVYRHMDASLATIEMNHLYSTSAGGQYMGETDHWDEFRDHENVYGMVLDKVIPDARIYFGESWNKTISTLNKEAQSMQARSVAAESTNGKKFDIKNNKEYAPSGHGTGRLLNGKYATARSAGNYLAGYNGATVSEYGFTPSWLQYINMAGAVHQGKWKGFPTVFGIMFNSQSYGPSPYYGEIPYAGRMIKQGFKDAGGRGIR